MRREDALQAIAANDGLWDVVVIGGGATGLGAAVDAAARGYKTLLLEQSDFAKATSSRSTKLIHGGVRYLSQGRLSLVRDSIKERSLLLRNAPHLVHSLPFIVPAYKWREIPYYRVGLKLYDFLAGGSGMDRSRRLDRHAALERLPGLRRDGLKGGIEYYDAQFDDAALALLLVATLFRLEGKAANYVRVQRLVKEGSRIGGVEAEDLETGHAYTIRSQSVINATGIFADSIRRLDTPNPSTLMTMSRGSHIVLPASFLPSQAALMVPKTDDGRVLFAIPWQERLLVGTTDIPTPEPTLEPIITPEEIDYLLKHLRHYLTRPPTRADILSCFAGLRPLVRPKTSNATSKISRDHTIEVSPSGLITIAGGKWTTYRKMGADAVDTAIDVAGLPRRPSTSETLPLEPPPEENPEMGSSVKPPGATGQDTQPQQAASEPPLHPSLPYTRSQVVSAVRSQMARTVEDVLARRFRALLLDAEISLAIAPQVASTVANEFGKDEAWAQEQIAQYRELAQAYRPPQ